MDRDKLAQQLLATFVDELEVHVAALNRDLLSVEESKSAGAREELLHALFRTVHTIKGSSRAAGVGLIEQASHGIEEVLSRLRESGQQPSSDTFGLLFGATDAIAEAGERLRTSLPLAGAPLEGFLTQLAAAAGAMRETAAPAAPEAEGAKNPAFHAPIAAGAVRIAPEKLEELVARSSDLLVATRRLEERAVELAALRTALMSTQERRAPSPGAKARAGRDQAAPRRTESLLERSPIRRQAMAALERFSAGYQEDRRRISLDVAQLNAAIMRLRMVPFTDGCQGLDRAVRDIAAVMAKEVGFVLDGAEVQLDRAVLEPLRDPLLHLVRNGVDHGIEAPSERVAAGKPRRGTVKVSAALRGAEVLVTVEDDGRGLDLAAVRAQLRRRHLHEPSSDEDVAHTIFLPGFSTARLITDISGRGVGLDVVKRQVEALRGTIDLSFQPGAGTKFSLVVPMTLTSLRALMVRAGGQTWVIPGTAVKRLFRVADSQVRSVGGAETLEVEGLATPLIGLAQALGRAPTPRLTAGKVPVVVVHAQGSDIGLVVDELLDEREVVVKSLGPRLRGAKAVSGITILPDGRLATILNVPEIVARARGRLSTSSRAISAVDADSDIRHRQIVLADDSITTRTLERTILEAAGYTVVVAVNGEEAWRLLQERGAALVVSDVEMPELDGFGLTERIRSSPRFRAVPVVLVTALSSDADKARGLAAGADAYLVKSSFDQKTLLETVAQLL